MIEDGCFITITSAASLDRMIINNLRTHVFYSDNLRGVREYFDLLIKRYHI